MKELCGICGCESAEWISRDETITYKGTSITVPEYRVLYCDLCEDGIVEPSSLKRAEQMLSELQHRVEHLLLPEEIRAIRKRLNLTQEEMAEICGGGVKAFARYENGTVIQSRAMDNLIRLIDHDPENLAFLRSDTGVKVAPFGEPAVSTERSASTARYY